MLSNKLLISIKKQTNGLNSIIMSEYAIEQPMVVSELKNIDTSVSEKELEEGIKDEYDVIYSKDGKKLLKATKGLRDYKIKDGTEIICDGAFIVVPKDEYYDATPMIEGLSFAEMEYYRILDGTLKSVYIPDSVTAIGRHAFEGCYPLNSVNIPNSVKCILEHAFNDCHALSDVVLPDSLRYLGKGAFRLCISIEKITIPDSVEFIGSEAFALCHSLAEVYIPSTITSIEDNIFSECGLKKVELPESIARIGNGAFCGCRYLHQINIPESVVSIGNYAFSSCLSLNNVNVPSSVTSIGDNPFRNIPYLALTINSKTCFRMEGGLLIDSNGLLISASSQLNKVRIPDSVRYIGNSAFSCCNTLKSIVIPKSVVSIGDEAFFNCIALKEVFIPDTVKYIGKKAFSRCRSLNEVAIPASITNIADQTFDTCDSLPSISIPKSIRTIGKRAFYFCRSLTKITLPDKIETIDEEAFCGCSQLTFEFPFSVTTVGEDALNCCTITKIMITEDATSIGKSAFRGCRLLDITIPCSVTTIGESAFRECRLTNIIIPDSVTTIAPFAFYNCKHLRSVILSKSLTSINSCTFAGCTSLENIKIPNSVTIIGNSAFSGCPLTAINIPDSVTTIGGSAFSECPLTTINIPDSVTTLGGAFLRCSALKSVILPNSLTKIGNNMFTECRNLQSVTLPSAIEAIPKNSFCGCSSLKDIIIPNNVSSICEAAFRDCKSLKTISLPESVTFIGNRAFYGCRSLKKIKIPETVSTIDELAFYGCRSLKMIRLPRTISTKDMGLPRSCIVIRYGRGDYYRILKQSFQSIKKYINSLIGVFIIFLNCFYCLPDLYANNIDLEEEPYAIGVIDMVDNVARGVVNICEEDEEEEAKAFKDSLANAEKGSVKAQLFVALHYKNEYLSHSKDSDSSQCIKWYTIAAENGSNEARRALAEIYCSDPLANDRNVGRAIELLQAGADNGDGYAMYKLGSIYGDGNNGSLYDLAKAFEWYMKGEKEGSPECAYGLGQIYLQQDAPYGKDERYAAYFLEKYIRDEEREMGGDESEVEGVERFILWPKEYSIACRQLGNMYLKGEGTEKNPMKGEMLINKSAEDNFKSGDWWKRHYEETVVGEETEEDELKYWIGHWYFSDPEDKDDGIQIGLYEDGTASVIKVITQTIPFIGKIKMSVRQNGTYDVRLPVIEFNLDRNATECRILEVNDHRVDVNSGKGSKILSGVSKRINEMFQETDKDINVEFRDYLIIIAPTSLRDEDISRITLTFCNREEDSCVDVIFVKGIGLY